MDANGIALDQGSHICDMIPEDARVFFFFFRTSIDGVLDIIGSSKKRTIKETRESVIYRKNRLSNKIDTFKPGYISELKILSTIPAAISC